MGHPRKYTASAYAPKILDVLKVSPKPLTRRQIAQAMQTKPECISTAMLELTRTGAVVKLPHTPHVAATYRLPIHTPRTQHVTRSWTAPQAFPWNAVAPVSLPAEPWADRAPVEALEGGKDARKPAGRSRVAVTVSGAVAAAVEGGGA
jgi:hypothetical protein